jgi:hypothetical protein
MTDYCAPASKVLTRVHVRNPDALSVRDNGHSRPEDDKSTIGETVCGQPMFCADLWQLVDLLPSDTVCAGCLGEPVAEQGALL